MSDNAAENRVHIEHEYHIPVSFARIRDALAGRLADAHERERFESLARLLHSIYHFQYHTVCEQLKHDYAALAAETPQDAGESDEQLSDAEVRFLKNFLLVMKAGNFRLLTQEDVRVAEKSKYLFTLPIKIDWDKLDGDLMPRFLRQHSPPEQAQSMPPFADRILVYKRGVGVDAVSGFLFLQKLDTLLDVLFGGLTRVACCLWPFHRKRLELCNEPSRAERRPCSRIHEDRFVQRITLRDTMTGLSWPLRRVELREPTFKEVVILFRYKTPPSENGEPAPPKTAGS